VKRKVSILLAITLELLAALLILLAIFSFVHRGFEGFEIWFILMALTLAVWGRGFAKRDIKAFPIRKGPMEGAGPRWYYWNWRKSHSNAKRPNALL
jgi:hypothetical protein